jgi:hypothetical protein
MTESRPNLAAVFAGLMLVMFLAAVNQTIIALQLTWRILVARTN